MYILWQLEATRWRLNWRRAKDHARVESLLRDHRSHVLRTGAPPRAAFSRLHGDDVVVDGLNPIEALAGSLPRRQARLVEAWAELHQLELLADWERLQAGKEPLPIEPLP